MFAFDIAFQTLFLGSFLYFCLWWTEWFDLLFALQVMEMLKLGKVTRIATEAITYEKLKLHQIYTWKHRILYFSSKQDFEEKSVSEHVIMEFIGTGTLFDVLMRMLTVIEHFEDLFDETLYLMRLKTLKMTLADLKTKNDSRWSRWMEMGQ